MEQQPHNPVPIELESQFIIRLPEEPSDALREAIRSGASNLKDRLFIQVEPDKSNSPFLRRGSVKFDGWSMNAKLVDLPTIIESHKTIDKKTLYKTADIGQLLICKEGEFSGDEQDTSDQEAAEAEKNKKDPNKVDKKYIYPHGECPPLKNCRRRRFRKTLKKKHCLDEPEIEKEVKRLFRTDSEATDVKWELLTEEELSAGKGGRGGAIGVGPGGEAANLGEQDLFGALSDIEDDDGKIEPGSEGDSTMYGDSSNVAPTTGTTGGSALAGPLAATASSVASAGPSQLVTQFSKDMFNMQPSGSGTDIVAIQQAKTRKEINDLQKQKQEIERQIATMPPVLQTTDAMLQMRAKLEDVEKELRNREKALEAFSFF